MNRLKELKELNEQLNELISDYRELNSNSYDYDYKNKVVKKT